MLRRRPGDDGWSVAVESWKFIRGFLDFVLSFSFLSTSISVSHHESGNEFSLTQHCCVVQNIHFFICFNMVVIFRTVSYVCRVGLGIDWFAVFLV